MWRHRSSVPTITWFVSTNDTCIHKTLTLLHFRKVTTVASALDSQFCWHYAKLFVTLDSWELVQTGQQCVPSCPLAANVRLTHWRCSEQDTAWTQRGHVWTGCAVPGGLVPKAPPAAGFCLHLWTLSVTNGVVPFSWKLFLVLWWVSRWHRGRCLPVCLQVCCCCNEAVGVTWGHYWVT